MKLVIFDLDGTLVDSKNSILASIRHALDRLGHTHIEVHQERALQQDLRVTLQEAFDHHRQVLTETDMIRFIEEYRTHNSFEPERTMSVFEGAEKVLQTLKARYKLAVATTKHTEQAEGILGRLGISKYFDHIQGTEHGMKYKPEPDVLLKVLDVLGHLPHEAVYVGDTHHDMKAAQSAGMKRIAATYGYARREHIFEEKPDFHIESIDQLVRFFAR